MTDLHRRLPAPLVAVTAMVTAMVTAVALAVAGCGADDARAPSGRGAGSGAASGAAGGTTPAVTVPPNPLAGRALYVDPANPATTQAARWQAEGRTSDAAALRRIGSRAIAHWLTGGTDVTAEVDAVVTRATAAGQVAVLVAYHIPNRDCGSYSAGGAASAAAYRSWIRTVAAGLKGRPAVVIVEPDAVPHAVTGCGGRREERFALLRDAVEVLTASPGSFVYLDAGHPEWVTDVPALAAALRGAGVERAAGFSLNVSNFVRTEANVAYGDRLSDALGGRRYVVDTSRNGVGPIGGTTVDGAPAWCNPPGRSLGAPPTTESGYPRVDALLWVKRPGESDGACRPGEPKAGRWWPRYALDIANRSA